MARRNKFDYDLIVIGSGSGGSVGANYAASLGKSVAIVEHEKRLGGECPNWACVPTKALLVAAEHLDSARSAPKFGVKTSPVSFDYKRVRAWKDLVVARTGTSSAEAVFHDHGIKVLHGRAHFLDTYTISVNGRRFRAKKFLLATGTTNFVPPIEGLEETGYITFKEAIDLPAPPKSLCIVGGGAIGCEFAELFGAFGTKVHLIEAAPRLLGREEPEVAELTKALMERKGIHVTTGAIVHSVDKKGYKKVVHFGDGMASHSVTVDEILIASGKRPNTDIGLENANVAYTPRGITTNKYMQTTAGHIYAAGDCVGPYQFTHTASYQSSLAGHNMFARGANRVAADYTCIPRCIFVSPEVASVGLTEEELKIMGIKTKIGMAPISILGRANVTNKSAGLVKIVCNKKGVVLGGSIVAPRAGEMIHELAIAIKCKATAHDIATMVHAFPTWSEAVKIAAIKIKD